MPKCVNSGPSDTVKLAGAGTGKTVDKSMTQILLTTCVGSKEELEVLVNGAGQFYRKNYQGTRVYEIFIFLKRLNYMW